MTDLSQVIRWNTGFIRGLAQSVLDRAKTIRSGLVGYSAAADEAPVKLKKILKTSKAKRKTTTPSKKTSKTRARPTARRSRG